jgi:hypothetical protein
MRRGTVSTFPVAKCLSVRSARSGWSLQLFYFGVDEGVCRRDKWIFRYEGVGVTKDKDTQEVREVGGEGMVRKGGWWVGAVRAV